MRTIISFLLLGASLASAVTYTYDLAGQLVAESYPNGAHLFYEYDEIGNPVKCTTVAAKPNPQADLAITTMLSPDPPTSGGAVTLTIEVTNNGPDPATEVTVSDALPAALAPTSATATQGVATLEGNLLTARLGTIPNGKTVTVTVEAEVLVAGALSNTAEVSAPEDGNAANDSATTATTAEGGVDLVVSMVDAPSPVLTGGSFVAFIATITNNGPNEASAVTHTLTLPAEFTFSFALPSQGTFSEAGGVVTTDLETLASGSSATITVGALTTTAGQFETSNSVAAAETEIASSDNASSVSTGVLAPTLVVTNTDDAGPGSLRQALLDANENPNLDVIGFDLPGFEVPVITPLTELPTITEPMLLDAFSAGANVVEIDGSNVTDGLTVMANDCTIRGMVINRCGRDGLVLMAPAVASRTPLRNLLVAGCILGADPSATFAQPNGRHGLFVDLITESLIGGEVRWMGNMLSGNSRTGARVESGLDFQITGNCIGTNATGTGPIPNNQQGISVGNNVSGLIIGSEADTKGNVISGNGEEGVALGGRDNFVWGNKIGTDINGVAAISNGGGGVLAEGEGNVVGGTTPGRRNVISGNNNSNVDLREGARVIGNLIGTNLAGDAAPTGAPFAFGVSLRDNAVLGGVFPGEGNVISANPSQGVSIDKGDGGNSFILGNKIGTNEAGTAALANINGVFSRSDDPEPKFIGLPIRGAGNLISGNRSDGISFSRRTSRDVVSNHVIQNNIIGADVTGTNPLPNGDDGFEGSDSVTDTLIGGTEVLNANLIAFNERGGIKIASGDDAIRNSFLGNSIHSNGRLGIALSFGTFGLDPVPNDPGDTDTGPNNRQNFPLVTMAENSGVVRASLNSEAEKTYRIEFFANAECDPDGNGEGERFLGTTELSTDINGDGEVVFQAGGLAVGEIVCATATDPDGNTSEFGPCFTITGGPLFVDTDGDGMSDEYETEHFGDATSGDPAADPDGDGETNLAESIALTDPNDPTSYFMVTLRNELDGIHIVVSTETGRFYTLFASADLVTFVPLSETVAGDGEFLEFIDPELGLLRRFYQVHVSRTAE